MTTEKTGRQVRASLGESWIEWYDNDATDKQRRACLLAILAVAEEADKTQPGRRERFMRQALEPRSHE